MRTKLFQVAMVVMALVVFALYAQEPGKTTTPSKTTEMKEQTEAQTPQTTPTKKTTTTRQQKTENVPEITCIAPKTLEKGKMYWYARRDAWMKDTPSAEGKKIYKVKANSVFVQLEKAEKGWLKVEGMINDTTKVQGYIYKAFLKKYPPAPEKPAQPKQTQPEQKSSQ